MLSFLGFFSKHLVCLSLVVWIVASCYPEELRLGGNPNRLSFSLDSLSFDTLVAGIRSGVEDLRIHNNGSKSVLIDRLWLPEHSVFTFWVHGQKGKSTGPFRILGEDSLLVLIEVTAEGMTRSEPTYREEWLRFSSGSYRDSLRLIVWEQDAELIDELVVRNDEHWQDRPAWRIQSRIHVRERATLEIGPGVKLYFENNAGMLIQGTLIVRGTEERPVIFTSVRQDGPYAHTPGQWEGIFFRNNSNAHIMEHVRISNANTGIGLGSVNDNVPRAPSLRLGNAVISDCAKVALQAVNSDTYLYNTLMYNSNRYLINLSGGNHELIHLTLSNENSSFVDGGGALIGSDPPSVGMNPQPFGLAITNSLLWGSYIEVLNLGGALTNLRPSGIHIRSSLVRSTSGERLGGGNNLWASAIDYPLFEDAAEDNYELRERSPARRKGAPLPMSDMHLHTDLVGDARNLQAPDIGAYEWQEEEN